MVIGLILRVFEPAIDGRAMWRRCLIAMIAWL